MAQFITLTEHGEGRTTIINIDQIVRLRPRPNGGTEVDMANDQSVAVVQDLTTISRLLLGLEAHRDVRPPANHG